jgi:hypothetical protein
VELAQNLHKEGTPKKEISEITGGKELTKIAVKRIRSGRNHTNGSLDPEQQRLYSGRYSALYLS